MFKDSAAGIELGRSFHQMGTVHVKVCESDFVPLYLFIEIFIWKMLHMEVCTFLSDKSD